MPNITIDNQDYDLNSLSDEAKALQAALPALPVGDTTKFN